ncbi:MAG: prepilin-type N-terminal cleavage/methylation domain-containing protein [Candidatus Moraniibacteriota bacterium]
MKNKKNKNYSGFSLLEMMISMFIFVLTIVTAVSIFSNVSFTRKNSREIQRNMEDARTALDLMAKNMRMSIGLDYNVVGNNQAIYMLNSSQSNCVSYRFSGGKLQIAQEVLGTAPLEADKCKPVGGTGVTYGPYVDVIENNVTGSFVITTTLTGATRRVGKATIILTVNGVNMQTSVSFRDYNNIVQ